MTKGNYLTRLSCLFYALCSLIIIISCSPDELSGGNSSETTNTAVVTSSNVPARNAKVRLIDAQNWIDIVSHQGNPVIDSAVTNNQGIVKFDSLPSGLCNLQIDHDSCGIVIRNFCKDGSAIKSADFIILENYASLNGKCSWDTAAAVSAMLEGTVYSSIISENGSFSFPKVAPGSYSLTLESKSGKIDISGRQTLKPSEILNINNINAEFSNIAIDNFEDGDTFTIANQITGSAWYRYHDSTENGVSLISETISKADDVQGYALHASITLHLNEAYSWAGVGFGLGSSIDNTVKGWDLSSVTAISFKAKGNGCFRVSLESAEVDSLLELHWPHFGAVFMLENTWKTVTIPVEYLTMIVNSLDFNNPPVTSWQEASKGIVRIEFEASPSYTSGTKNLELWLDDVKLEGISDMDLLKQFQK